MTQQASARRRYALDALARYWPRNREAILGLDMPQLDPKQETSNPPAAVMVSLPEWAHDIGVNGALLVPATCQLAGDGAAWNRVDWLCAAYWYVDGCAEREFEAAHGPIHSYSHRLTAWDARLWERAWANRIALFLRRLASRHLCRPEEELFGARPQAEIVLTHDVDAIVKSWSLRAKQSAFHAYNAARHLARGEVAKFARRLGAAARFAAVGGDLWYFEELAALEAAHGFTSHFFVYGGRAQRTGRAALIDPAYDVLEPRLANTLQRLRHEGFSIGLHQSYDSWRDPVRMREEKRRVEQALGESVSACRQHWLRFSWADTWKAQEEAGLQLDATLGFNDRPGFRNGAALRFHPWNDVRGAPQALACMPMILMDSQLHDYADLDDAAREREMRHWVQEVRAVGGVATVLWHQHVLGPEYGWRPGLETLLGILRTSDA